MIPKTIIFFAVSCLTAVTSASDIFTALDTTLQQGNGNFILQLNHTTCIKDFVPRFMDNALQVFTQSLGENKVEKRNNNKIVRRDTEDDQVHVFDAYEFGSKFKAITVKFQDLTLVKDILGSFDHDILKIIPDMDIKFDVPTKKTKYSKRYYGRNTEKSSHQRAGNFHYDSYKHDKNCPHAHDEEKLLHNGEKLLHKRAASCVSGSLGKKNGDGYNGYCCATQADCKDSCISGKCNGPKKSTTKKTTTVKKATTTKKTTTVKKTTAKKTTTKKTTTKKTTGKKTTGKKTSTKKTTTKASSTTTTKSATSTIKPASTTTTTKSATTTTTTKSATATPATPFTSQKNAQWNLVRVSEKSLDLTKPYIYDSNAGADAYVYVIDDGMYIEHTEFEGRAKWGFSAFDNISQLGSGHGTHVSGIIGGKTYGVAKKTNLIAVQILDENGDGTISSILAGLQFVTSDSKNHVGKSVINMSVGLQTQGATNAGYTLLNTALSSVVAAGVPMFAAAGNWNTDTCQVLPAGNKDVFAVAAIDKTDTHAYYSGWGTCVQIYAPGTSVLSSYIGSTTTTTVLSGTSMASPHAAGVAALLIGDMSSPTAVQVYNKINSIATANVVKSTKNDTPNLLLFNGQTLTSN